MTGALLDLFLEMEREIRDGELSPEDVVEKEQTIPGFKLWRRLRGKDHTDGRRHHGRREEQD